MKRAVCLFLCVAGTLAFVCAVWAQAPDKGDTDVQNGTNANSNFGTVKALPIQGGTSVARAYIALDLSRLPAGATSTSITKATLRLYFSQVTTAGNFDVVIANGAWNESTLTYNNQPPLGPVAVGGVPVALQTRGQYVIVDITALVKLWLLGPMNGGIANNGIVLVPSSGSLISAAVASKEDSGHDPDAEIDFVDANVESAAAKADVAGEAMARNAQVAAEQNRAMGVEAALQNSISGPGSTVARTNFSNIFGPDQFFTGNTSTKGSILGASFGDVLGSGSGVSFDAVNKVMKIFSGPGWDISITPGNPNSVDENGTVFHQEMNGNVTVSPKDVNGGPTPPSAPVRGRDITVTGGNGSVSANPSVQSGDGGNANVAGGNVGAGAKPGDVNLIPGSSQDGTKGNVNIISGALVFPDGTKQTTANNFSLNLDSTLQNDSRPGSMVLSGDTISLQQSLADAIAANSTAVANLQGAVQAVQQNQQNFAVKNGSNNFSGDQSIQGAVKVTNDQGIPKFLVSQEGIVSTEGISQNITPAFMASLNIPVGTLVKAADYSGYLDIQPASSADAGNIFGTVVGKGDGYLEIQKYGKAQLQVDNSTGASVADWVVASDTPGLVHDTGSTSRPTSGAPVGIVLATSSTDQTLPAGTARIELGGPFQVAGGSAGSPVTITANSPLSATQTGNNSMLSLTGLVDIPNGGTGIATGPSGPNQVLHSNAVGTGWTAQLLAIADLPSGVVLNNGGPYNISISGSAATAGSVTGTFVGDVTGTEGAMRAIAIQGQPWATTTPASGQVPTWNGTSWAPRNPTSTSVAPTDWSAVLQSPTTFTVGVPATLNLSFTSDGSGKIRMFADGDYHCFGGNVVAVSTVALDGVPQWSMSSTSWNGSPTNFAGSRSVIAPASGTHSLTLTVAAQGGCQWDDGSLGVLTALNTGQ